MVGVLEDISSPLVTRRLFELAQQDPSPEVQEEAVYALTYKEGSEITDLLVELAKNAGHRDVREAAIDALGEIGDDAAVAALEALADMDDDRATKALRQMAR